MRIVSYVLISIALFFSRPLGSLQTASTPVVPAKKAETTVAALPADWRAHLTANPQAPVKVVEFFDYQCPFCGTMMPVLENELKNRYGKIELILKHDPLPIHPDSMLAHEAALASGEQGKFWEMHDLLFAHQKQLKRADLVAYARQIGLDIPRFGERLDSEYYRPAVERDMALAKALGVNGTPTFFINGQKLVGKVTAERLQAALDGEPETSQSGRRVAGLSSLDLSHSPVRGPAAAPVTIIEFSDLQCPFCARVAPTMQELLKQYPTQVKWIFKNFPLGFHADSELAHRALLAANEQGKFWEMHDLIFANQKTIKKNDLMEHARELNLDMTRFTQDMESDKVKSWIESDKREGNSLRVNGTPTFFINEREYSGALSLGNLKSILNKELAVTTAGTAKDLKTETQEDVVFGPAGAPVTLVWFSDLQSELTIKSTLIVRQLMNTYPGKIRLIFKNRPLESHPDAMRIHEAAMAANAQGKFWELHDLLVANPKHNSPQDLLAYAQRIGLDLALFQSDMQAHKYRIAVERDLLEARRRAVEGAPVFFLNATRIDGLQSLKFFEDLMAQEMTRNIQASSR